jgi:hypothetical protein
MSLAITNRCVLHVFLELLVLFNETLYLLRFGFGVKLIFFFFLNELSAQRLLAVLNQCNLFFFGLTSNLVYSHFNLKHIGFLGLPSGDTEQLLKVLDSVYGSRLLLKMDGRLLVLELNFVVEAAHELEVVFSTLVARLLALEGQCHGVR